MKPKRWWIKERHNPQLGVYYLGMGQLSDRAAKAAEKTAYGFNVMLSYDSEEEYTKMIRVLNGEKENQ